MVEPPGDRTAFSVVLPPDTSDRGRPVGLRDHASLKGRLQGASWFRRPNGN